MSAELDAKVRERRLASGAFQVGLRSSTPPPFDRTWTTVVHAHGRGVVIDPGFDDPRDAQALASRLRAHGVRDVASVLVSHAHPDHVAGLEALRNIVGPVPVRAHPLEADRIPVPVTPLQDGRTLMVAGRTVRALATPGHAAGHLAFVVDDVGVVAGDLVTGTGASWVGTPHGDPDAYLESLERVRALAPAWLAPAHGDLPDDPNALLDAARAHRHRRARQVLAALDRPATLTELAVRVYGPAFAPDGEAGSRARSLVRASLAAHLLRGMRALEVAHLGDDEEGPYARFGGRR